MFRSRSFIELCNLFSCFRKNVITITVTESNNLCKWVNKTELVICDNPMFLKMIRVVTCL